MFQEIWPDNFVIQNDGSIVFSWKHAPDEEGTLDERINIQHYVNDSNYYCI